MLQSQTYATVAAGIEAVEAGHAAIIRYQLYQVLLYARYSTPHSGLISFQQLSSPCSMSCRLCQATLA